MGLFMYTQTLAVKGGPTCDVQLVRIPRLCCEVGSEVSGNADRTLVDEIVNELCAVTGNDDSRTTKAQPANHRNCNRVFRFQSTSVLPVS